MKQLEGTIQRLLQTRDQSQIFHWNTKSYAAHKALKKFYDDLLELTDNLFESCKGKYPDVFSKKAKIPFSVISEPNVTAETMIPFFSSFNEFLEGVCRECEASGDLDIQDIVLEMKNATNKLLYLLALK
jgi:hypothetical protein